MTDVPIWVPLVTGLGGIVLGRFSMSKKERADVDQKNYENSVKATETHDVAYKAYFEALSTYQKADEPSLDEYKSLMNTGDSYFNQISRLCDTILANKADPGIRDNTWIPKIKVTYGRLLPKHYDMLKSEALKRGYPYTGRLRRRDHESIFAVAEKYCGGAAWVRPHEDEMDIEETQ